MYALRAALKKRYCGPGGGEKPEQSLQTILKLKITVKNKNPKPFNGSEYGLHLVLSDGDRPALVLANES